MVPGDLAPENGNNPVSLYHKGDLIGFEAGMGYEKGLPITMHVEVDNLFEGVVDFKALEMTTFLKL